MLFPGVGTILDAALWNMTFYSVKAAINGNWDWGDFGKSAVIGLASGALGFGGSLLTNALNVTGALGGAAIGGLVGGVTGGLGGGIASSMNRGNFWQGFGQGFLSSALAGGVAGGITGYQNATAAGANGWTGVKSIITYETELKQGVNLQPDPSRDCTSYAMEYADRGHFNRPASDFRDPNYSDGGGNLKTLANNAGIKNAYQVSPTTNSFVNAGINLQNGAEVIGNMVTPSNTVHAVNITHIKINNSAESKKEQSVANQL